MAYSTVRLRAVLQGLPLMFIIPRYYRTEMREYAGRFRHSFLRQAPVSTFDVDGFPVMAAVPMLACMHMGDAGYPVGGSLAFARNIEQRYLDLGGELQYGARVQKILVEDDRAVGVRLDDGTEHRAEWVISAADGRSTIFDLLDGEHINDDIAGYYENLPIFSPLVQVSLGVRRDLLGQPQSVTWLLEEPVEIAGKHLRHINCRHYSYDPNMAPPGRSVVVVLVPSNYAPWKAIADDPLRYEGRKGALPKRSLPSWTIASRALRVRSRWWMWLPPSPMNASRATGRAPSRDGS